MSPNFLHIGSVTVVPGEYMMMFPHVCSRINALSDRGTYLVAGYYPQHPVTEDAFTNMDIKGFCWLNPLTDLMGDLTGDVLLANYRAETKEIMALIVRIAAGIFGTRLIIEKPQALYQVEYVPVFINEGFVQLTFLGDSVQLRFAGPSSALYRRVLESNVERVWSGHPCQVTVMIGRHTAVSLSGLVRNKVEISGDFALLNYTELGNADPAAVLVYDNSSVKAGTPLAAPAVTSHFSFHTHPSLSAATLHFYTAWPSSIDMRYIAASHNSATQLTPILFHAVIAPEGIWCINPSPGLQRLMESASVAGLADRALNIITDLYLQIDKERSADRHSPIRQLSIQRWFLNGNANTTVGELITALGCTGHLLSIDDRLHDPLYIVKYVPWSFFEDNTYMQMNVLYWYSSTKKLSTAFVPGGSHGNKALLD